jgi:hypothetical protein
MNFVQSFLNYHNFHDYEIQLTYYWQYACNETNLIH